MHGVPVAPSQERNRTAAGASGGAGIRISAHCWFSTETPSQTLTASLTLAEPSEIGTYLQLFGEYAEVAVYGAEARALITRVLSELASSVR